MVSIKKVVTAQRGGVQSALGSAHRAAVIDTLSSTGIGAEVVAELRPAVFEDAGSGFPLGRQGATDRVAHQVANVSAEIQAGQRTAHLSLRAEQCRGRPGRAAARRDGRDAAEQTQPWRGADRGVAGRSIAARTLGGPNSDRTADAGSTGNGGIRLD